VRDRWQLSALAHGAKSSQASREPAVLLGRQNLWIVRTCSFWPSDSPRLPCRPLGCVLVYLEWCGVVVLFRADALRSMTSSCDAMRCDAMPPPLSRCARDSAGAPMAKRTQFDPNRFHLLPILHSRFAVPPSRACPRVCVPRVVVPCVSRSLLLQECVSSCLVVCGVSTEPIRSVAFNSTGAFIPSISTPTPSTPSRRRRRRRAVRPRAPSRPSVRSVPSVDRLLHYCWKTLQDQGGELDRSHAIQSTGASIPSTPTPSAPLRPSSSSRAVPCAVRPRAPSRPVPSVRPVSRSQDLAKTNEHAQEFASLYLGKGFSTGASIPSIPLSIRSASCRAPPCASSRPSVRQSIRQSACGVLRPDPPRPKELDRIQFHRCIHSTPLHPLRVPRAPVRLFPSRQSTVPRQDPPKTQRSRSHSISIGASPFPSFHSTPSAPLRLAAVAVRPLPCSSVPSVDYRDRPKTALTTHGQDSLHSKTLYRCHPSPALDSTRLDSAALHPLRHRARLAVSSPFCGSSSGLFFARSQSHRKSCRVASSDVSSRPINVHCTLRLPNPVHPLLP
jgi:hypothetical protein